MSPNNTFAKFKTDLKFGNQDTIYRVDVSIESQHAGKCLNQNKIGEGIT